MYRACAYSIQHLWPLTPRSMVANCMCDISLLVTSTMGSAGCLRAEQEPRLRWIIEDIDRHRNLVR